MARFDLLLGLGAGEIVSVSEKSSLSSDSTALVFALNTLNGRRRAFEEGERGLMMRFQREGDGGGEGREECRGRGGSTLAWTSKSSMVYKVGQSSSASSQWQPGLLVQLGSGWLRTIVSRASRQTRSSRWVYGSVSRSRSQRIGRPSSATASCSSARSCAIRTPRIQSTRHDWSSRQRQSHDGE